MRAVTPTYDAAIVGGGPAGQAAAELLVAHGLKVAVIDEQPRPGGQILRQPPSATQVAGWMTSEIYRGLRAQLARFEALTGLDWFGGASVAGIFRDNGAQVLQLATGEGGRRIVARRVLVAAGCYDMAVPLPGWTLPGVMSVGAIQTLLKGQQVLAGRRILFAGTHPLMLIAAEQVLRAGAKVEAVVFAQPLGAILGRVGAAPGVLAGHAGKFLESTRCLATLRWAGVPVRFGAALRRIEGEGRVERAVISLAGGEQVATCDAVGLGYGFLPQSDLVRQVGAHVVWAQPVGGWAATHDGWMRSSINNLYVAGETLGVRGADAALASGWIAGVAILLDSGCIKAAEAERLAASPRRELRRLESFARLLADVAAPGGYLPEPTDETLVCRCEGVSAGMIRAALAGPVAPASASALKLETRAGMGLCQGRNCEHSVLRMLGSPLASSPGNAFTARFPARPVPIGALLDDQNLAPDATQ